MDSIDDILAHHGVKGMKWGVRRAGGSASPVSVSVRAVPGKKIKTTGGKGHNHVDDAINTAVIKRVAKKSSTSALTNHELQTAIKRMQLEQQFAQLRNNSSKAKRGQAMVKQLLGLGKTANEAVAFNNSPAGVEIRNRLQRKGD